MSSKRIIVVFGATGSQGGAVVKSILNDPAFAQTYQIRAITRDPSKPAGTELSKKGVEVLKADLNDLKSLESVMKGAYAVFAVTNYHEKMDDKLESQQGYNMAEAAKATNVQHLIWSTSPSVAEISGNKYTKVHHFEGKARVTKRIRELGIPATFLHQAIFFSEVPRLLIPNPNAEAGTKAYMLVGPVAPTSAWPLISVTEDTGKYVKAILSNRDKMLDKDICTGESYTFEETAQAIQKAGLDVIFQRISIEQYRDGIKSKGVPDFFVDDMAEMVQSLDEFGYFGKMDVELGKKIVTSPLETLTEYFQRSPDALALR